MEIDLTSGELRLVATAQADGGRTVGDWATLTGVHVAVNGDLFDPFTLPPAGLAFGGGRVWSGTVDGPGEGFLAFDRAGGTTHVTIEAPEIVGTMLGPEVEGVVGGRPLLLAGGAIQPFDCADALTFPCEPAPRTAAGVSEDGHTLFLIVVDGWQAGSVGLTAFQTAEVLQEHGAFVALAPGGSSTLYVRGEGGLASSPSDGIERVVANHVGLGFTALPPGNMIGVVRERDITGGADIVNARVPL